MFKPSSWFVVPILAVASVLMVHGAETSEPLHVESRVKPDQPWKRQVTRTLEQLPGFSLDTSPPALNKYGGIGSDHFDTKGYFRTEKVKDRWWLIDPAGGRFFHMGVVSVRQGQSERNKAALLQKFGTTDHWASATVELLSNNGFNGTGAWSDTRTLQNTTRKSVYTLIWNFMASYGAKRGGTYTLPGHTGYPNNCIFVFDPEFETFCDNHAKALAKTKDDPWLLGHFSDNEMPLDGEVLDRYLQLPPDDHGYKAADAWMQGRRGSVNWRDSNTTVTEIERSDFLTHVVDRYFRIVSSAIKKHDPNHLYLGARFNGPAVRLPEIYRGSGPYVDVHSVNYYNAWTPRTERMEMWEGESGKPAIVSEFYVKGADTALGNTSGAGWEVKTQADRGLFYQNYVLGLIESGKCVGWHWFRYMDNDPAEHTTDPSNQDSNKGVVDPDYQPYSALLQSMRELNTRAYLIADYFDQRRTSKPATKKSSKRAASKATSSTKMTAPEGVVIEKDIKYLEPGRKERLDLYYPAVRKAGTLSPAVLIIHGGGWVGGDKSGKREFVTGTALAQAGYVCVSVEYMKEEGKRWPTNLHDCKNGVRWLRKNAQRLQLNPDKIGVIGGSAGGHLALMVAYTADIPGLEPQSPYPGISSRVHACVDMYGITNVLTRQKTDMKGNPTGTLVPRAALLTELREEAPEKWKVVSPTTYVTANVPPTLIIHGDADTTVDREQSKELASLLAKAGVEHELLTLPKAPHAFALNDTRLPEDLRPKVVAFFDKHLKKE